MQGASSWGRKVTEAVIWRNIDWISFWISASDFSAGGGGGLIRGHGMDKSEWVGWGRKGKGEGSIHRSGILVISRRFLHGAGAGGLFAEFIEDLNL